MQSKLSTYFPNDRSKQEERWIGQRPVRKKAQSVVPPRFLANIARASATLTFRMKNADVYKLECFLETRMKLTAVFEEVPEGYIGFIEELPGANTQGATIEEARSNLKEAVEFMLEANRLLSEESLKGKRVIREPISISA
jgi:predicted RNase H-like HicB family nuclease